MEKPANEISYLAGRDADTTARYTALTIFVCTDRKDSNRNHSGGCFRSVVYTGEFARGVRLIDRIIGDIQIQVRPLVGSRLVRLEEPPQGRGIEPRLVVDQPGACLLYTSPSPRDRQKS